VDLDAELHRHRRYLVAVAYRLLGTMGDAEDVVQEAFVRAARVDPAVRDTVVEARAWLTRIVTNGALDVLRSARVRRESYAGTWLPEPVVGPAGAGDGADPADRVTLHEQVSLGLLRVLESLSPAERAVYVLHEAFGLPLEDVAGIVGRSAPACRQLAVRARRHVQERAPRFDPDARAQAEVVAAFQAACESGDLAALAGVLDESVVLRADGGGVVTTAPRPVEGRAGVVRALAAGLRRTPGLRFERRTVNGFPGLVAHADGQTYVLAFAVAAGRVTALELVAAPDKVRRVPPPSAG
jgi:RNA polymerase sigma-70 factor (ECF subfamily)